MSYKMTPQQSLLLWNMLTSENPDEREPLQSKATPSLRSKERKLLVEAGYLSEFKREGKRGTYLALTDKAWAWAQDTVDVELMRSAVGAKTLQGLLRRLLPYLQQNGVPLAALFTVPTEGRPQPTPPSDSSPSSRTGSASETEPGSGASSAKATDPAQGAGPAPNPDALWVELEAACLSLGSGARKRRVRLSALRERLASVPRSALDEALRAAQRAGRVVLYRDDNTAALTPADHEAALIVGGAPRHIVYLED